MKYAADLTVNDNNPETLLKAFFSEDSEGDRSSFELKKKEKGVLFKIKAKDAVALRARLNSIVKLLQVYEKV